MGTQYAVVVTGTAVVDESSGPEAESVQARATPTPPFTSAAPAPLQHEPLVGRTVRLGERDEESNNVVEEEVAPLTAKKPAKENPNGFKVARFVQCPCSSYL